MAESTNPISQDIRNDLGTAFQAYTLPVIHRDSIIVAVAAPNDNEDRFGVGNSSPDRDGWYHSQMYLCKNLCKETAREQYWLTCVDPTQLVQKYTRFLHSRYGSGQKIVLDSQELKNHEDMIVVPSLDLRQRFLDMISEQLQKTKDTKRQLIIMIFGDGLTDPVMNFGIHVGGEGPLSSTLVNDNLIELAGIKKSIQAHNQQAQVLLMSTACRSGGWSFSQYVNQSNVNGWQPVPSIRLEFSEANLCGSLWADAIANTLCRDELVSRGSFTEGEAYMPSYGPDYSDLVEMICPILKEEVDDMEPISHPSFNAEHDAWDRTERLDSGFPLSHFKERYDGLRTFSTTQAVDESSSANTLDNSQLQSASDASEMIQIGDNLPTSIGEAYQQVSRLGWHYMRSYPGDNSAGGNISLHGAINRYLRCSEFPENSWVSGMGGSLAYRLTVLAQLNRNKVALCSEGETIPFCHQVYHELELHNLLKASRGDERRTSKAFQSIAVRRSIMFEHLPYGACRHHHKPDAYMNYLFHLTKVYEERLLPTIEFLVEICRRYSRKHMTIKTLKLMDRPGIRSQVQAVAVDYERREELRRQEQESWARMGDEN